MREKRDEIIILRTTKAEKNRIYEKMLGMGIRSLSAYIRKMALDGYCLNLDLPQLRRMEGITEVRPNVSTQPEFGTALAEAKAAGVQVLFLLCHVGRDSLEIVEQREG